MSAIVKAEIREMLTIIEQWPCSSAVTDPKLKLIVNAAKEMLDSKYMLEAWQLILEEEPFGSMLRPTAKWMLSTMQKEIKKDSPAERVQQK